MRNDPNRLPHALLALLFALTLASQVPFTVDVIRAVGGWYVQNPIWVRAGTPVMDGDRVLSIDSEPVSGTHDIMRILYEHRPGDVVTIAVQHQGQTVERRVRLQRHVQSTWFMLLCFLALPWLSIPLGFWVAALRPRDLRAWLMLGILLGMSQLIRNANIDPRGWPVPIALPGWVFHVLALNAWAPCMLMFGIYFPHRWRVDERVPWGKWLLLAPLAYTALADSTHDAALFWSLAAPTWLPALPNWLQLAPTLITLSLFFVAISFKFRDPGLPSDDRRRLKLLYAGCTAAMTPFFLLWMYSMIVLHREGPPDNPITGLALAAFILFPLTMAYVVVVERAMDVRMVIRQGLQYALARRGVRVIQIVITSAVLFTAFSLASSTGVNRPARIILISLGVASIFWIRRAAARVRVWVDRRFFREAYNSEQILDELSEQVRSILDRESLLETVCRRISESLHVDRIAVLLREDGFFRPALATGYPAPLNFSIPGDSEPGPDMLAHLDSQLLLPLPSRKELLGYISLGPKKSEEPYSPSDTQLLRTVAAQTGLALENSRLSEAIASEIAQREMLHREIEIAREVQQRLFPQRLPEVPALEYAAHCRPARGVGGDYYDFLALSSGRLGLAIADISGKGIPAALLMASLQASVRGQSQAGGNVAELMAQVNRLVFDASPENRYATFFYAQFDPATRRLVYTNGGHNAPMLLRGGEVLRLETGGPVVGLFRPASYEQEEIQLQPGDLLVLYTDGISEAENPQEEEWGETALIETASICRDLPPGEIIARIMQAADTFAAGAPQHDDMTVVVAKVWE
jgi:sigma-B regulation protein RsbU (phosphoserine phosphatase)